MSHGLLHGAARNVARIGELAWPLFIGQISVVAFATVDTLLLGRHSAADLAALSVGTAAYITVFIGLMGVVLALSPIVGQLYGAGQNEQAGRQLHQAVWLALALSVVGAAVLLFPAPFMTLARMSTEQEARVRTYLAVLALSLPASLLFSAYRGFNNALSRPKAVMALQVGGLALKLPLSAWFIGGIPVLGIPSLGVVGCAVATAIVMWMQALAAWLVLRRSAFYVPFRLWGRGLHAPDPQALWAQLRLGVPMGLSILIEVSGFAMMAVFIARLGTNAVAGHQIAANLVSLMFMLPMALAIATSTLVAQRLGARDLPDARALTRHGIGLGVLVAAALGSLVYLGRAGIVRLYTQDAAVIAAALPILAWVALFHLFDATQTMAAFVLRAHRIATVPMFIFAASLWGIGLGGGYLLAFDPPAFVPAALHGAPGYWVASTIGLTVAASLLLAVVWRVMRARPPAPAPA
ncbi:MAG TPA: MATE family efflux transporter [Rubrivivax sp.]|nr:MATE family efflux transporter [Burkholderiales bacterium]HNT37756.1 MATE family efflux transporter [Rubrivivax sp.]